MGWLAGAMAGGGAAGLESIKTQEASDLQMQRDARLNEWKTQSENRLAGRQEAADERRATREDARWNAEAERKRLSDEAAGQRHRESVAATDRATAQRDAASQRQYNAMMARIGAMGDKSGDGADNKRLKIAIDTANAMREAGNTEAANKVLEQVWTTITGKAPPALPPKPAAAPGAAPAAGGGKAQPKSRDRYQEHIDQKFGKGSLKDWEANQARADAERRAMWNEEAGLGFGFGSAP